jgi:NitT/TauT family transport system ATP-binding protein
MHRDLTAIQEATHKTILFVTHSVEEALVLSDRVFLFSARPAFIKETIEVDIPRPREVTGKRFVELQRHLLASLDAEVDKMMEIAGG